MIHLTRKAVLRFWPPVVGSAALVYAWASARAPSVRGLTIAGGILVIVAGCLAAVTALSMPVEDGRPGALRARRYLGVTLFLWTLAEASRTLLTVARGSPPAIPSFADLLRLAGYLAIFGAIVSTPAEFRERYGRSRDLMDTIILILAGASLSWLVILRPVSSALPASPVLLLWLGYSPVLDLVLILLMIRLSLLSDSAREARGAGLLGGGIAALMFADLARGYLTLGGDLGPSSLGELGWILGVALIGWSVFVSTGEAQGPSPEAPPAARPLRQRIEPLIPMALTYAVVIFTLVSWRLAQAIDWVGVGAAIILSLLLVARQGVIGGQSEMRQFAELVNASADLAFVAQPDGQLKLANPAVARALGMSEAPTLLEDFLFSPKPSRAFMQSALREGWTGEVEFRRADGTIFPAALGLRPVWDERLGTALLVATAHDLTHIRQREDELRAALSQVAVARSDLEALNAVLEQRVDERTRELADTVERLNRLNEELQELGKLKSEFVALVSHELRAPLTNIRAGIELLLATHPDLSQGIREPLALVASETERLTQFVESILDLSALEAGRFPLQLAPTEVEPVARRVVARLPAQATAERLRMRIPASLPCVQADERALGSVFFHLLDNALKYAASGEVSVEGEAEGGRIAITVSDRGPGIPADERERVFEMFHRLDARDSREVYGHGLGLHISRRLLEAMGGEIVAEDAPGGGARLKFWLPAARGE